MAFKTARRLVLRGRPPVRAAGNIGAISDQAASVKSVLGKLRRALCHTTEPRLSELQRPAGLLFVVEPHDLSNIWLIWARVGLRLDHSCEFSISAIT